MLNKLFRNYNQNRRTIWVIIIFIAFFVILLQTVFALIRDSKSKQQAQLLNTYYQNINNAGASTINNQNKVNTSKNSNVTTSEKLINDFVNLCNSKKIEEAYNMLTEDCKTALFPTINYFKSNYYNKIFTKEKSVKIESSMYGGDIYKITYSSDLLANGGYSQEDTIQDYIYIGTDAKKISLNQFLHLEEINKTENSNGISIKVIDKKVYLNYEEYQIQISNNTEDTIYIAQNEEEVYLLDQNNIKYTSNIDGLQNDTAIIEPNKISNIELTFYKNWRFSVRFKDNYIF